MLWLMAKYANGVAEQKGLGIRFQVIVPQQMIAGTGVGERDPAPMLGDGIEREAFLARFGRAHGAAPIRRLRGRGAGRSEVRERPRLRAQGLMTGITVLEEQAA